MKRLLSISFVFIFLLQVGIKSLVSLYFQTIAKQEAEANCIYKTITVCKGNCFVTKQVKIFTSLPIEQNNHQPGFDLDSFKDALCLQESFYDVDFEVAETCNMIIVSETQFYSYQSNSKLLRPPIV